MHSSSKTYVANADEKLTTSCPKFADDLTVRVSHCPRHSAGGRIPLASNHEPVLILDKTITSLYHSSFFPSPSMNATNTTKHTIDRSSVLLPSIQPIEQAIELIENSGNASSPESATMAAWAAYETLRAQLVASEFGIDDAKIFGELSRLSILISRADFAARLRWAEVSVALLIQDQTTMDVAHLIKEAKQACSDAMIVIGRSAPEQHFAGYIEQIRDLRRDIEEVVTKPVVFQQDPAVV